jgi:tol-pal system-associated acyl-CoA thioesterase
MSKKEAYMNEFVFPTKVYIDDTDYGGIVYHANYLKFMERARSEWIDTLDLGIAWQQAQGIHFVIRYANVDFLKPAVLNDRLEIVSCMVSLRHASFICNQYVRLAKTPNTIICRAEVKIVCVDQQFQPKALPKCLLHDLIKGESV